MALALTTGARRSEILNLSWDRVDLTAGTAFVPVTKNGDPKTLLLTPAVISELRRFRGLGLVFPGAADPRTPFNPRAAWSRAVRDAGLEPVRIHDLRHSVAVNMIRGGATLEEIAAQLGHRDLSSSARYAKLREDDKVAVRRQWTLEVSA